MSTLKNKTDHYLPVVNFAKVLNRLRIYRGMLLGTKQKAFTLLSRDREFESKQLLQ